MAKLVHVISIHIPLLIVNMILHFLQSLIHVPIAMVDAVTYVY